MGRRAAPEGEAGAAPASVVPARGGSPRGSCGPAGMETACSRSVTSAVRGEKPGRMSSSVASPDSPLPLPMPLVIHAGLLSRCVPARRAKGTPGTASPADGAATAPAGSLARDGASAKKVAIAEVTASGTSGAEAGTAPVWSNTTIAGAWQRADHPVRHLALPAEVGQPGSGERRCERDPARAGRNHQRRAASAQMFLSQNSYGACPILLLRKSLRKV
jgi:hypothetical protein